MPSRTIHGRYFADGFLLEAASLLADAGESPSGGRLLYDADRVVFFTALAVEAHINHAIETGLSGAAVEAARLLRIKEKLKLVPGLANSGVDFDAGREPLQGLHALLARRNELVHAKPDLWKLEPNEEASSTTIVVPRNAFGTKLPVAARWILSLCQYLDALASSGAEAWSEHAYLAREMLTHRNALEAWEAQRDGPELRALVDYLVDADFDDEG